MNKALVIISIFLIFANSVSGQNESEYRQLIKDAVDAYNVQDYKSSVELFQKAYQINNTNAIDLFNGACSAALNGDTITAFNLLNLSADYGYKDIEHIEKDCDLYSLRNLQSWKKLILRIKENKKNYLSSDKVLESIIESIQNNNSEDIWNLGSANFKETQNRDSVEFLIEQFHSVLSKYNFGSKDLSKSQSKTSIYNFYSSNWKKNETQKYNFILTPKILGESTKDYFRRALGYEIYLELSSQENKWTLNKITITNKYFDKSFNCKDLINSYFNDSSSVTCQMGVVTSKKEIACLSTYRADKIDFVRSLKTLKWQEFMDIPISGDTVVYKMYFVKKTNEPKNNSESMLDAFFKPSSSYEFLEIAFVDKNDYMVVSDGEMYGIYKGNINEMKEWILDEFKKVE